MVKSLRILLPFKPTNTRSHPTGWMGEIEWIVLSHISYTSLTTSGSSTTSLWTTTLGGTSTWRRGRMCSKQLNNWWKQIRMRFWKKEKFQWRWILTLSIGIASKTNVTVFVRWRQNNAQSTTQFICGHITVIPLVDKMILVVQLDQWLTWPRWRRRSKNRLEYNRLPLDSVLTLPV